MYTKFTGHTFEEFLNYLQAEVDMTNKLRKQVETILGDPKYHYINKYHITKYGIGGRGVAVVYTNHYDSDMEKEDGLETMFMEWYGNESAVSNREKVH